MKIEFKKITNKPKYINICYDYRTASFLSSHEIIRLNGELIRLDSNLVKFNGNISGELELICVKTGGEFRKVIYESLILYFSDGIWEIQNQRRDFDLDVIEFFDGFIAFDVVVESEVTSIRLDYNIKE